MESDLSPGETKVNSVTMLTILLCLMIIGLGTSGMIYLQNLKEPPPQAIGEEQSLTVRVMEAESRNIPIFITGYGEARSLNSVSITPEISGRVTQVHKDLELGEIIRQGEVLFKIDPELYEAAVQENKATVKQRKNSISMLEKQLSADMARHNNIKRNRNLAKTEYDRLKRLFDKDGVGSQSGVDKAEKSYIAASDQSDQMALAIELYPIRIEEARNSLISAQARLAVAEKNLRECTVTAPFTGRIKQVQIEKGQHVSPGQSVLILADDSILEILVPLDSREVRKWLEFIIDRSHSSSIWFADIKKAQCEISWTEENNKRTWDGQLHRVVEFNPMTRMITVAVRVDAASIKSDSSGELPLIEGMFCSIKIPGKTLSNVFQLPRQAVTFENEVYIALQGHLKTVAVEVAWTNEDFVYVSQGLKKGDVVITTRLVAPLEGILLKIITDNGEK